MDKRVLSFGGGVQTTAMAILMAQGKIQADEVVFADTGAEKPETYWYMESYTEPLFKEIDIPFIKINPKLNLLEYCERYKIVPSVGIRWCTKHIKVLPIKKYLTGDETLIIGFSVDESQRAHRINDGIQRTYPLIELGISSGDCHRIISDYGWPMPLKSSCFCCPFQRWTEWNWLKGKHPELIQKCLEMEELLYSRRPQDRHRTGVFGGKPLWKWTTGIQSEWEFPGEYSCYSGDCGH